MSEPYTFSRALIDALVAMGAERVYGIVGTSNVAFVDALGAASGRIRYISCRHEQVAGSMADAEGRLTGRPGVVLTHSGPGAFNALISLGNAYKDCSPLICITGAVKRRLQGSDGMLEADHRAIFRPICKGVYRIEDPGQLAAVFEDAYAAAMSGARGPVLIEVPEDVWDLPADEAPVTLVAEHRPPLHVEGVWRVLDMLAEAERPLLLAGAGVSRTGAAPQLVRLAEKLQVPVATTGNGRGAVPESHPLSLGRVGFGGGNSVADAALEQADLVLGLGCTISDMSTYEYTLPISGEVVLVNLDLAAMLSSKFRAGTTIEGDAGEFIDLALHGLGDAPAPDRSAWFRQLQPARDGWQGMLDAALAQEKEPVSPARLMRELSRLAPADTIVTVGAGLHLVYAMDFWPLQQPNCFLSAVNFGAMGFGFPAALGAKLAYPGRQVVAVEGDGDFLMTVQDLETAVRERIGVKVVVLNDNMYRVLDVRQRLRPSGRVYGTRHGNPDFVKLAEAFGAEGLLVERLSDLEPAAAHILEAPGPLVAEVRIDPDDLPPLNLAANLRMNAG